MRRLILVLTLMLLSVAAWATSLRCSIDDFYLYFTGKTRLEMGTLLYQHECASGHVYWLTSGQMSQ